LISVERMQAVVLTDLRNPFAMPSWSTLSDSTVREPPKNPVVNLLAGYRSLPPYGGSLAALGGDHCPQQSLQRVWMENDNSEYQILRQYNYYAGYCRVS